MRFFLVLGLLVITTSCFANRYEEVAKNVAANTSIKTYTLSEKKFNNFKMAIKGAHAEVATGDTDRALKYFNVLESMLSDIEDKDKMTVAEEISLLKGEISLLKMEISALKMLKRDK